METETKKMSIVQYKPLVRAKWADAVRQQIMTGWVGCGPTTKIFENEFAQYTGAEYAMAVTSGTAALLVALMSIEVGPGDEVIVPDYSFIAAANCARLLGATVVLVDVKRDTMCLDPEKVREKINDRTKAIIFVNHNGYAGNDAYVIEQMCDDEAIFMVEDSACALGQWYDGKTHAGLLGNIGCFSFSVPKLITTGQGGMVVTNDEALKVRCMEVIDQGSTSWRRTGIHEGVGANFKFNDICAAYGLAQLNDIEELLKKRYSIHTTYLEEGIPLHTFPQGRLTGPWTNILVSKKAQAIKFALLQEGIESRLVYRPLHLSFKRPGKVYKNSRYLAEYALYLPSSLSLTKKQVRHICSIIKSTGV